MQDLFKIMVAVFKVLIEFGWFEIVAFCAVLCFVVYKAAKRPKKQKKIVETSTDEHHADIKKISQDCEDKKVLCSGEESEIIRRKVENLVELSSESEVSVKEKTQNFEAHGPLHSQNVQKDHLKGGKPALESDREIPSFADKSVSISAGSKEDTESDQIKLDTIKSEMIKIVDFLEWCEHRFGEMSSGKYVDNFQVRVTSAIDEFTQGIENQMSDFSQHGLPKRRISHLASIQLMFVHSLLTALCTCEREKPLSPREKEEILKGFAVFGSVCFRLRFAFNIFEKATRSSFGIRSNSEWNEHKEEIEESFTEASQLLEDYNLVESDLLNVEKIVESLNADVRQFTDDVLKI